MTSTEEAPDAVKLNLPPLKLGKLTIDTPVVLSPMAGITNSAFRRLCAEYGGGLYVCEMVTSRALVERTPESMRIIKHAPEEEIRSIQLYGVEPNTVRAAVRMLVEEDRADHIDLNFGCPAPKVTRKGGGSALPWKTDLFEELVRAAVDEAHKGEIPLTVKVRKGIDDEHMTFREAGKIAHDLGVDGIAIHGRTTNQHYAGKADWGSIAELREQLPDMPVIGNGDIFAAEDAVAMVEQTGVDAVQIGRGVQGKPWLFGDLQNALSGSAERFHPSLGEVSGAFRRHAELLIEHFEDEFRGLQDLRKHVAWYFKGYQVGGETRSGLAKVSSMEELDELLGQLDADAPYPGRAAEGSRGRAGSAKRPHLPQDWLESRSMNSDHKAMISHAELDISGG
ncbi:MAG: tRNA dihydrouridine synthase DusB [Arthrobacter sp.]|nr:tRNA dihydrouridine synthase DusB [Arthrobacter sp.]